MSYTIDRRGILHRCISSFTIAGLVLTHCGWKVRCRRPTIADMNTRKFCSRCERDYRPSTVFS